MQSRMKGYVNPEKWKELLSSSLPGAQAQLKMAPTFRGSYSHNSNPVRAAVLALMYPAKGQTRMVFIKRNEYNGPHSGQVSFPGGAWESGDDSLEETAIRETREELGIVEGIEVLGSLSELHIPVSNFLVTPFMGWMDHTPVFQPDATEVQYIIEAIFKDLMDPSNRASETLIRHEQLVEAPFYRVGTEKIWGATAMILSEVLQLAATQP